MELSEEELRMLEQMERALVEEDPKLASTLRGTSFQSTARRRSTLGGAILLVGIALLVGAVLIDLSAPAKTGMGVLGFVVMLGGAIVALTSARTHGPAAAPARPSGRPGLGVVDGGRRHRPARARAAGTFMERVEQRWQRRRERGY